MFKTLRWAWHAIRYGEMMVNRRYSEPYTMYVPGRDTPIVLQPGQRAEIIVYPVGK